MGNDCVGGGSDVEREEEGGDPGWYLRFVIIVLAIPTTYCTGLGMAYEIGGYLHLALLNCELRNILHTGCRPVHFNGMYWLDL